MIQDTLPGIITVRAPKSLQERVVNALERIHSIRFIVFPESETREIHPCWLGVPTIAELIGALVPETRHEIHSRVITVHR